MRAKKGEWFSLKWEPNDYYDRASYEQLKSCPVFICAPEETSSVASHLEQKFDKLRLASIIRTTMFINLDSGIKVPTHYNAESLMPGDNPKYDSWLKDYFSINNEISEQIKNKNLLQQKSIYLEHTARIIRHDMHSGINTYIPRGLNILIEKLPEDVIKKHRLGLGIKLLKEGLKHTQGVYQGVYEFTNLVKRKPEFKVETKDLKVVLDNFIKSTSYSTFVEISDLKNATINSTLFCIAIGNFIMNGLTYNDSREKLVKIYLNEDGHLIIEDNGRGMTQMEYDLQCMPYMREEKPDTEPSGLGINIANAILNEHGFKVRVDKLDAGTAIKVIL